MSSESSQGASKVIPMVSRAGRLADALQRARQKERERLAEDSAARSGRLAALYSELSGMAAELPPGEDERFTMVASHTGDRLVIDPLSYVDLDPANLHYRLVRQRREGPETVLVHEAREAMANGIADYIADRIVEREGLDVRPLAVAGAQQAAATATFVRKGIGFWGGFWLFILGALCAATALFTYAWLAVAP
jgi:hypothetical protein